MTEADQILYEILPPWEGVNEVSDGLWRCHSFSLMEKISSRKIWNNIRSKIFP